MPDNLPKIPVPSVEQINKYPWASQSKVMFGCIVFLLAALVTVILKYNNPKDCDMKVAAANARADKAEQKVVEILQENIMVLRGQDSTVIKNKQMKDTLSILKAKLNESATLSKKAVIKTK